ncbi:MAG: FCD domain-containing protein [Spirochaetes bacterium]|jgi:GntR family transcriptional repressor for pyruvate dehydrogenase complex|nr:FCD domain-containing protein [Spirochaetota bacterium]
MISVICQGFLIGEAAVEEFQPIKRQKASDLIVEEIWKMILEGKLKPGDRLPPEHRLVERFQVSKVTLREALQTLETYGHITRKRGPGGGSIVLDIAPTRGIGLLANYMSLSALSLDQLMEARLLVEPTIAGLAARRITPEAERRLEQLLADHEIDFRTHGGSKRGWEFYILLAEITGNRLLKVIEELLIRLFMDAEFALSIGDIGMSPEEIAYNAEVLPANRRIAAAVIAGDPEAARREMTEALRGFTQRITSRSASAGRHAQSS